MVHIPSSVVKIINIIDTPYDTQLIVVYVNDHGPHIIAYFVVNGYLANIINSV